MFSSAFIARACNRQAVLATSTAVRSLRINLPMNNVSQKPKEHLRKKKQQRGREAYRFVDRIRLRAVGGSGGKGSQSKFTLMQAYKKRPDGGHGGRGGHVILIADPSQQTLRTSHPVIVADSGTSGAGQDRLGRGGKNKIVRVPCGVVVRRVLDHDEEWDEELRMVKKNHSEESDEHEEDQDLELSYRYSRDEDLEDVDLFDDEDEDDDDDQYDEDDDEEYDSYGNAAPGTISIICEGSGETDGGEDEDLFADSSTDAGDSRRRVVVADLDHPGSWVVVAQGGRGGRGNNDFASIQGPLPDPKIMLKRGLGEIGETAYLELELKLIADLGLVGFPNAGKSSLLAAMSRATPEIAPYPFTTLHPLIGVIEYRDGVKVVVADVPGLVAGASEGRGRGHDFLRHIERTKALMYMVDSGGVDGRDPVEDLRVLVDELASYGDGELLNRPAIVAANKVDLLSACDSHELKYQLERVATEAGIRFSGQVVGISAGGTGEGLGSLSRTIRSVVYPPEADLLARDDVHRLVN